MAVKASRLNSNMTKTMPMTICNMASIIEVRVLVKKRRAKIATYWLVSNSEWPFFE
jgi:hypothetical protein